LKCSSLEYILKSCSIKHNLSDNQTVE
jgi:hypothetical protein